MAVGVQHTVMDRWSKGRESEEGLTVEVGCVLGEAGVDEVTQIDGGGRHDTEVEYDRRSDGDAACWPRSNNEDDEDNDEEASRQRITRLGAR
ncbi:hypothetical protein TRIUR3_33520 [Triticum urartu]|uniref:Uncharacterized protein n=1 Tax=Triticum urartu TaxID=4572 RepID=M7ZBA9_TRIUA|nr:hypothetical protein TRIUR3_33520 [Triticum urartu]